MADEIKQVFDLGSKGVNLVDIPYELDDSEVLTATNMEPSSVQRNRGLRKRGGLAKVNSSAINSGASIGGLTFVPPNFITTDTLYAGLEASAGTNTWRTSTNGTSWGFVTTPALPQQSTKVELSAAIDMVNQRCVTFNNKLYYPGNTYTPLAENNQPYIVSFDGTTASSITTIPQVWVPSALTETLFVTDLLVFQNHIYIATADTVSSTIGRVFELDPLTGELKQIGADFSAVGYPWVMCVWQGNIWLGTYSPATAGQGRIYSINPTASTAWTLRHTTTAGNGWITSMCNYRGTLYFGTQADSGATAHIRVSSSPNDGSTWANSDVGPSGNATANYDSYNALVVFDDVLYALYYHTGGSPAFLIRKLVAGVWSTDYDIETNFTGRKYAGQSLVWNGALYFVIAEPGGTGTPNGATGGMILRKPLGGAWSKVDDISARSFLGSIQV